MVAIPDLVSPTLPDPRRDEVELYVRTYSTLLRSSGAIPLRALEPAHRNVGSSLHAHAPSGEIDTGALLYAVNRLPSSIIDVAHVILGQLSEDFRRALGSNVEAWTAVSAPARRRQWHYDGDTRLAVHVLSPSDVDDVVPTLVAYQIEWNKMHDRLSADRHAMALLQGTDHPTDEECESIRSGLNIVHDDWRQLLRVWGSGDWAMLKKIADHQRDMTIQLLGGTYVGYAKLTRRWWQPIERVLREQRLSNRPTYFVSSNLHSLVNLLSGYARRRSETLWSFLESTGESDPESEAAELAGLRGHANDANALYYAARLWGRAIAPDGEETIRKQEELARGIYSIAPTSGADIGAQIIDLSRLHKGDIDLRLADVVSALQTTNAVIVNVDYPLGLAAHAILRQVVESIDELRGVYVLGKAATLNGNVGDVLIADYVYDEHTGNSYSFENAFTYHDVAPYLERGAVLDNQRAVTVKGTFLQNTAYLDLFYREAFTVVEMEAGPYLSALYEDTHSTRHPVGTAVHFRHLPVDVGFVHYASDTPYTRARTLGSRSLSFDGVDATYASTVAILRRILSLELKAAR